MTSYFPRELAPRVLEALGIMPVVVLTGMRQTGKTTLLLHQPELGERRYVTLDDFAALQAAQADPDAFVQADAPLTIDEAQKCPALLTAIKRVVDRNRRPGQYLLSGSANFLLLKGMAESLAGRSVYFELRPFSRRELLQRTSQPTVVEELLHGRPVPAAARSTPVLAKHILLGGMPGVCLAPASAADIWFAGYEQTYLERDIRQLGRVDDILALRNLLKLCALRTGQLLSQSQLGRDAKLNAATVARFLSLFETSCLTYRLSPYLRNRASRLIKSPKLYFTDAGLAAHLAGIDAAASLLDDPLGGALFETYVAQNLLSLCDARIPKARLHFWAVQGRHEVDFIVEAGRTLLAIETKASRRWTDRDLTGLRAFLHTTPDCRAAILAYNGSDTVPLGERLWAMPASQLLA